MKISQKTFSAPVQDELLEIKNFDKYDKHITKLMAFGRKKHMVISICWFDLYYITLEIKSNTDFFDNGRHGPCFLIKTWASLIIKSGSLEKKNPKHKLKIIMSKIIERRILMTWFE